MSEHTSGPWMVATSCSFRRIVSARGEPVCIPTVQRSDGHPDIEFPNGGPEGPDASLITAAPELYEALAAFERVKELWLPGEVSEEHAGEAEALHGLRRKMLNALAQARGEK